MTTCYACGREGRRGFMKIGGFWLDRVWGKEFTRFLPTFYVCSARLACMRRIFGSGYTLQAFNEWAEQDARRELSRKQGSAA